MTLTISPLGPITIEIGSLGVAAESNTIRVGHQGTQTATYVAGVFGSMVIGDAVVASNSGKARDREVFGPLCIKRYQRYGRGERRADETASSDLRLQG